MNSPKTSSENIDAHSDVERRNPGISTPISSMRCAECGLRIIDIQEACFTMGYFYHNSCFMCCYCRQPLSGKTFYKDQDKVYCADDYLYCGFQETLEKCMACGNLISETIIQAMGNYYHPGCFTCTICSKCLDDIPFTIGEDNQVYCLPDYYRVFSPLCAACGLTIIPEKNSTETFRVVALGKDFHLNCYRCNDCKKKLGNELENRCYPKFELDTGNRTKQTLLLCLGCHSKRIGAVPATTPDLITVSGKPVNSSATASSTYKGLSPSTPYRNLLRK